MKSGEVEQAMRREILVMMAEECRHTPGSVRDQQDDRWRLCISERPRWPPWYSAFQLNHFAKVLEKVLPQESGGGGVVDGDPLFRPSVIRT